MALIHRLSKDTKSARLEKNLIRCYRRTVKFDSVFHKTVVRAPPLFGSIEWSRYDQQAVHAR
jgi:hypothetical protein